MAPLHEAWGDWVNASGVLTMLVASLFQSKKILLSCRWICYCGLLGACIELFIGLVGDFADPDEKTEFFLFGICYALHFSILLAVMVLTNRTILKKI